MNITIDEVLKNIKFSDCNNNTLNASCKGNININVNVTEAAGFSKKIEDDEPFVYSRDPETGQQYIQEPGGPKIPVHDSQVPKDNIVGYIIRHKYRNEAYVGITKNGITREYAHFNTLKRNTHRNYKLQEAYNRDGRDAFEFIVLKLFKDEDLDKRTMEHWETGQEVKYQNDGYFVYNCTQREKNQRRWTPESRAKRAAQLKGNKINKGRKASTETRVKLSKAKAGENNPFYGKKHSQESLDKMIQVQKLRRIREVAAKIKSLTTEITNLT